MKVYTVEQAANFVGIPESVLLILVACDVLESAQSPRGEILIIQEQLDKFMGVKK